MGITYSDLFREHHARVVSLCRLLLPNPDEAEEVGQEVFTTLLRVVRQEQRPIAWGHWLTRVAVNACHDRRRSRWRTWWQTAREDFAEDRVASAAPSPEDEAIGRETRAKIWRAYRSLPIRQREVFVMRQLEGWSTEEVAEELGLSAGSVKTHLFRAVHRLRDALRET